MYDYDNSIDILISKFPLLRNTYEENIEDYEGLPYVFYESIFVRHINDIITSNDECKLMEISEFLEDMLENGDERVKNLIEVAVIESLYFEGDHERTNILMKFLGSLAKTSYNKCTVGGP